MYDLMTTDTRPGLAMIKTPVTVLYPFDPAMGAPTAMIDGLYANAYAALPGVTLQRIDGARHFIMLDAPQAFTAAVEAFLR
jgi:pimeloyl-[acyl-carrier protein] methyl ester esterase